MDQIKYIECCCHDFDHVTRVHFLEDPDYPDPGTFFFEYRVDRFPGWVETLPYKTFWDKVYYRYAIVRRYFRNIWWAIKGRPLWFTGYAEIEPDQARNLIEFMEDCLDEQDKKDND